MARIPQPVRDLARGIARRMTVNEPQRQANPGIYGDPREIAAEAASRVAPEDPAMRQLFGVTRDDLYQMSQGRVGNEAPNIPEAVRARGSAAGERVTTRRNANRIVNILGEAEQYPELIQGSDAWYNMQPAYDRLEGLLGPVEGAEAFRRFNTFTGMASPGSDVLTEINRGTAANFLANQGRFGDFQRFGGMAESARGADFPADMSRVMGHPYHSTAHGTPMSSYVDTGQVNMQSPKVPLYIQSSGVPETGFQTSMPVGDAHFSRGIGLADVRTNQDFGASITMPELRTVAPWWERQVANRVGIEPGTAQARMWNVLGPQTGVDTPVGAPKLELLSRRIMQASQETGIPPEVLRDQVLMGRNYSSFAPAAPVGAGIMGGLLMDSPEESLVQ